MTSIGVLPNLSLTKDLHFGFLMNACVSYDDTFLFEGTYFELRPICDGEYTFSSCFYGDNSNYVQIRMGRHGQPCQLVAKYGFDRANYACRDFFELSRLGKPLWYNGNDILSPVSDAIDLVAQIAAERFEADDDELAELFANVGLNEEEQGVVMTRLDL